MPTKFTLNLRWPVGPRDSKETKPITVTVSDPVVWQKYRDIYQCAFKIKIPDFIWSQLAGKRLPRKKTGDNERDVISYSADVGAFSKTLSQDSLYTLCNRWEELIEHYEWSLLLDKHPPEKVIFYSLGGESKGFRYSHWDKEEAGHMSRAEFVYGVGFRTVMPELDSEYRKYQGEFRYDEDGRLIGAYQNDKFYELNWVKWTEQRQLVFDQLQLAFDGLNDRLGSFEKLLGEDHIDQLAAAGVKGLLGGAE